MAKLILEGVAGTGKSSVLAALQKLPELKNTLIITEDFTLGELFSELQDKSISHVQHINRLQSVLNGLDSADAPIILERFHHSYFALGIPWGYLKEIDEKLAKFNFKTALLDFENSKFASRSLKRKEREEDGWEKGFLQLYGSVNAAIEAFKFSQHLRHESLRLSKLESRIFNTDKMDWDAIAKQIIAFTKD